MTVRNFSAVTGSDEKGIAPVIGTAVTIAIVFILTGLISAVVFEDYTDSSHKGAPVAKLHVFFTEDGGSLEFEHSGGDPLFFDSPSLSVIMDVNGTSYPLNDTSLGTLKAGGNKALALNRSVLTKMELVPGDPVTVKVVDIESGGLIAKRELEVKRQLVIVPE
ncbi:type IV pilin [Methanosarcina sp.]|jgi:flagellin-like protein|uniref:type IV pilin n=1 Tax=Methanosarcina sp. TaxID=2213 RepID=UPI002C576E28|nr:type IV pilin [Methanosarcina sp.]HOW14219.1 type IV pilin [Methanosarcina sp.]